MLGFKFTQLKIDIALGYHYLPLWNYPANQGKKTNGVSRKHCG